MADAKHLQQTVGATLKKAIEADQAKDYNLAVQLYQQAVDLIQQLNNPSLQTKQREYQGRIDQLKDYLKAGNVLQSTQQNQATSTSVQWNMGQVQPTSAGKRQENVFTPMQPNIQTSPIQPVGSTNQQQPVHQPVQQPTPSQSQYAPPQQSYGQSLHDMHKPSKKSSFGCCKFICWSIVLSILGFMSFMIALFAFPNVMQPKMVYMNWVRIPLHPSWCDLFNPEKCGNLLPGMARHITVTTSDGVKIAGWHILPRTSTPLLLKQHAGWFYKDKHGLPRDEQAMDRALIQGEEIWNASLPGVSHAHVLPTDKELTNRRGARVFVYFHGNAANRGTTHRWGTYKLLRRIDPNAHVITIDYRGFGESDRVQPTEVGVRRDVEATWKWLRDKGVAANRITLVGHSLGTGPALYLANHLVNQSLSRAVEGRIDVDVPASVILFAPFSSIPDAALTYGTIPLLKPFTKFMTEKTQRWVKDHCVEKWNNDLHIRNTVAPRINLTPEKITQLSRSSNPDESLRQIRQSVGKIPGVPVLILHGDDDLEIPLVQAQNIFSTARSSLQAWTFGVLKRFPGTMVDSKQGQEGDAVLDKENLFENHLQISQVSIKGHTLQDKRKRMEEEEREAREVMEKQRLEQEALRREEAAKVEAQRWEAERRRLEEEIRREIASGKPSSPPPAAPVPVYAAPPPSPPSHVEGHVQANPPPPPPMENPYTSYTGSHSSEHHVEKEKEESKEGGLFGWFKKRGIGVDATEAPVPTHPPVYDSDHVESQPQDAVPPQQVYYGGQGEKPVEYYAQPPHVQSPPSNQPVTSSQVYNPPPPPPHYANPPSYAPPPPPPNYGSYAPPPAPNHAPPSPNYASPPPSDYEMERLRAREELERERMALEQRRQELERLEKEQQERFAALEREKVEREVRAALEKERLEKERLEKERLEKERMEVERLRLEQERYEKERLEKERLEKERLEQERLERERLEKERAELARMEHERQERERLEKLEMEKREQERLEAERLQAEKMEQERLERERIALQERLEREKLEKERLELERLEKERAEKLRLEQERAEIERLEREKYALQEEERRLEQERLEKEQMEAEKKKLEERLAMEKLEEERRLQERLEQERRAQEEAKEHQRLELEKLAKERAELLERERRQAELEQELARQREAATQAAQMEAEKKQYEEELKNGEDHGEVQSEPTVQSETVVHEEGDGEAEEEHESYEESHEQAAAQEHAPPSHSEQPVAQEHVPPTHHEQPPTYHQQPPVQPPIHQEPIEPVHSPPVERDWPKAPTEAPTEPFAQASKSSIYGEPGVVWLAEMHGLHWGTPGSGGVGHNALHDWETAEYVIARFLDEVVG